MIKLEHTVLPSPEQMEFVIEGLRNPMNSWDNSDSEIGCYIDKDDLVCSGHNIGDFTACDKCGWCEPLCYGNPSKMSYKVGSNDLSLMQKLSKAGTDHRKFMRMMPVMVRITAPLYWWKEFDTYKVGTVANSCSTMHKIQEKSFTVNDFSMDLLMSGNTVDKELKAHYKHFGNIISSLNNLRDLYLKSKDKKYWRVMIEMLPSSYNQTRNVMLNYEVLVNIYHSRINHKLTEWRDFCEWIESLPYSELIIGEKINE